MAERVSRVAPAASFLERLAAIEAFLTEADAAFAYDRLLEELRTTVIPNPRSFRRIGRRQREQAPQSAEAQAQLLVACIGNLNLFAGALNISASNNPFGMKKQTYKDSGILLTKKLASRQHFKFTTVEERSATLAAKAVELWPIP